MNNDVGLYHIIILPDDFLFANINMITISMF